MEGVTLCRAHPMIRAHQVELPSVATVACTFSGQNLFAQIQASMKRTVSLTMVAHLLGSRGRYRLDIDELEQNDLAATEPARLHSMQLRLNELASTAFLPVRCPPSVDDGWGGIKCMGGPQFRDKRALEMANGAYRGFYGPFVDVE